VPLLYSNVITDVIRTSTFEISPGCAITRTYSVPIHKQQKFAVCFDSRLLCYLWAQSFADKAIGSLLVPGPGQKNSFKVSHTANCCTRPAVPKLCCTAPWERWGYLRGAKRQGGCRGRWRWAPSCTLFPYSRLTRLEPRADHFPRFVFKISCSYRFQSYFLWSCLLLFTILSCHKSEDSQLLVIAIDFLYKLVIVRLW
jgi:hypothetical protein